jgi:hypothetical protein
VTVRFATAAVFLVATAIASTTPVPAELPAIALGQVAVYRVKILLALVYGGLLLLTPFFEGVLNGRMPIEISHRGAVAPGTSERENRQPRSGIGYAEAKTFRWKGER